MAKQHYALQSMAFILPLRDLDHACARRCANGFESELQWDIKKFWEMK